MTKADFEAIAHVVKQEHDRVIVLLNGKRIGANIDADLAIKAVAIGIASHCAKVNPRFNRHAFMVACGLRD